MALFPSFGRSIAVLRARPVAAGRRARAGRRASGHAERARLTRLRLLDRRTKVGGRRGRPSRAWRIAFLVVGRAGRQEARRQGRRRGAAVGAAAAGRAAAAVPSPTAPPAAAEPPAGRRPTKRTAEPRPRTRGRDGRRTRREGRRERDGQGTPARVPSAAAARREQEACSQEGERLLRAERFAEAREIFQKLAQVEARPRAGAGGPGRDLVPGEEVRGGARSRPSWRPSAAAA